MEGGKGSRSRFVTSLNLTTLQPSLVRCSLARALDIKQQILIGHVVQRPSSKGLEYFSGGDDDVD